MGEKGQSLDPSLEHGDALVCCVFVRYNQRSGLDSWLTTRVRFGQEDLCKSHHLVSTVLILKDSGCCA